MNTSTAPGTGTTGPRAGAGIGVTSVGIIAAYKAQQKYLKKIFRDRFGNTSASARRGNSPILEISTVDGFQGREMDIIIFSCVRTKSTASSSSGNTSSGIGFMSDWQRLNVAITRARYGLWIVGDIRKLEDGGMVWKHLIEHCHRRKLVFLAESSRH
jgi:senataxin